MTIQTTRDFDLLASNGQVILPGSGTNHALISMLASFLPEINAYNRMDGLTADEQVGRQDAALLSQAVRRLDAQTPNAGFHLARDLEQAHAEITREKYPPHNALRLFFIDTSISEGVEYHTGRRIYAQGEVQEIGTSVGQVVTALSVATQQEERFPVRHYATHTAYSWFERLADGYARRNGAGVSKIVEDLRVARDVLAQHANFRTWHGNVPSGQYGVLNYPWVDKYVLSVPFTDATSGADLKDALMRFADRQWIVNKQTFGSNKLGVSPRVLSLLKRKTIDNTVGGMSVYKWFLDNNGGVGRKIVDIEEAWELQGVGPGGTDAMIAYRDDRFGISNVMVNPFGRLPLQQTGFSFFNYMYMSHGGVKMVDVGNNCIGYVEGPTAF